MHFLITNLMQNYVLFVSFFSETMVMMGKFEELLVKGKYPYHFAIP